MFLDISKSIFQHHKGEQKEIFGGKMKRKAPRLKKKKNPRGGSFNSEKGAEGTCWGSGLGGALRPGGCLLRAHM